MAMLRILVSVKDEHVGRLDDVAAAAETVGMTVNRRLASVGVFSGVINDQHLGALQRVSGVAHVSEDRDVRPLLPDDKKD